MAPPVTRSDARPRRVRAPSPTQQAEGVCRKISGEDGRGPFLLPLYARGGAVEGMGAAIFFEDTHTSEPEGCVSHSQHTSRAVNSRTVADTERPGAFSAPRPLVRLRSTRSGHRRLCSVMAGVEEGGRCGRRRPLYVPPFRKLDVWKSEIFWQDIKAAIHQLLLKL
ncbi:hypothetical protein NDU88_001205 [Pleurodeles waltl]|uniref:Uncharacterized protein n=1 Tax=Pleurodeles waltl TaxID=8319 RepID=A0AAV7RC57_PLEWA|nr:hypothetical protein NDU88_001205 [Pleurodeles waltl]